MSSDVAAPERTGEALAGLVARGGVSPRLSRPTLRRQEGDTVPGGAPAAAHPNFSYHGGPVVTCPLVNVSLWGSAWTTDPAHLTRAGRLAQFHQDLVGSNFMNVLSQYGWGGDCTSTRRSFPT